MFVYKWHQIWWAWKQVALILIICLILSFLIYQLLTISADSLTWMMSLYITYVIRPHKSLFVFSSKFDCIFWFLLEQLRTSVVLLFHSYSPMSPCVSAVFIGIVKHCQSLLIFSFSSANRTQSFFFFLLCHKVTIKIKNQFMGFPLVWEISRHAGSQFPHQGLNPYPLQWKHGVLTTGLPGKSQKSSHLSEWQDKRLYRLEIMPDVLRK